MIERALAFGWPTLLVVTACAGLGLANWVRVPLGPAALVALALVLAASWAARGRTRLALVASALTLAGLAWGSLRLDALGESVLARRLGVSAPAVVVVTAPPRSTRFAVRAFAEVRRFAGESLRERVLLELPAGRAPPLGSVLELGARPAAPRGPETGFDERAWLALRGVHVVLRGGDWRIVGRRGGIGGVADRLRAHVASALARGTEGERRAIVAGVVLGADEGLDEELRRDFRASGLYHLLAVSGQNVALIVGGVLGAAWVLGLHRALAELLALGAIGTYVLAVGWQPSVVRAGVAGALASLAWLAARPRDRWHFLALGALVLLAWTPAALFDAGFQLSFVAVGSIFVLVPVLQRRLDGLPLPAKLAAVVAVAAACGAVTAPILWLHFGSIPLWTVPANALAEPAMPPLLGFGLAAAAIDPVSPPAATALSWLAGWCGAWLALCAGAVASAPFAEVSSRQGLVLVVAVVLAAVVCLRASARSRQLLVAGLVALAAAALVARPALAPDPTWPPPQGLRVTFLDVGQGDAALVEVPAGAVLVDQGPPEAEVARQLRRAGVVELSALVLTHPQRDHIGGAPDVLRDLRVGVVLDPGLAVSGPDRTAALEAARERGVQVRVVRSGHVYRLGRLRLAVLWPDGPGSPSADPNTHAIVLLASFGAVDVLLTADAESDVTASLPLRSVEVLKVAHHGSEDPGLAAVLRVLRPRVAVVSVGRDNEYGHPRDATLAALAAVPGLRLFRTDRDGRVVVESDGLTLSVRPERRVP